MCGDLTPVYPTTGPVGVMIVKRCVSTAWSMDVPIGWKYTNPFGSMYRTMKPTSSMCAITSTRGDSEPPGSEPRRLPRPSVRRSVRIPCHSRLRIVRTGPSNPGAPLAFVSSWSSLTVASCCAANVPMAGMVKGVRAAAAPARTSARTARVVLRDMSSPGVRSGGCCESSPSYWHPD